MSVSLSQAFNAKTLSGGILQAIDEFKLLTLNKSQKYSIKMTYFIVLTFHKNNTKETMNAN